MKTNETNISIFEFMTYWQNEGYGIALMEASGDNNTLDKVITPYIDPSDYPKMIVSKSGNGATVMNMGNDNWYIAFHSGALEERFNEQQKQKNKLIDNHPKT